MVEECWDRLPEETPLIVEVFGPEGAGKTHFACTFPTPVILDTEGRAHTVMRKFGLRRWKKIHSWSDLREAAQLIVSHVPPGATVVIDSASNLQDMAQQEWLRQTGQQAVWPRVNWAHIFEMLDSFITYWRPLGYHLVLCERIKPEFDAVKEAYTGHMIPDRYRKVPYEADIVLELQPGLILDGVQVTRRTVARVHKNHLVPHWLSKPYLLELSYEAMLRDLSMPWTGSVDDLVAEARRLEAEEAEKLRTLMTL